MLACIEGNTQGVATILTRSDVDINIVGKDGVTAISLACLQGNMDIVKMLLNCKDVNINKMTVDGVTPFTVSIFKGHTDITTMLLDRPELVLGVNNGDGGHVGDGWGQTEEAGIDPLHVAAAKGQVSVVKKLIRFGVEFDRLRSGSHTALPVAIMKCRRLEAVLEIVLMLLEAGCQPNLDNVRLAILRVPHLQSVLYHAATNPSSLKKQTRKIIWRQMRLSSGGRNIQPRILSLKSEIPDSLLNYLLFIDAIM